jgi:ankyrin repeat protein
VLVRFGADSRLTTREGFSALHIAAFSGHSDILLYIMSLKHR